MPNLIVVNDGWDRHLFLYLGIYICIFFFFFSFFLFFCTVPAAFLVTNAAGTVNKNQKTTHETYAYVNTETSADLDSRYCKKIKTRNKYKHAYV